MKICFYSPYIPKHFGGGEKHLFDVAYYASAEHTVSIAISSLEMEVVRRIKQQYSAFTGYDLKKISFITTPLGTSANFLKKILWTKKFDAIYYVTDGSLFFSLAKDNYLHIQIPFMLDKSEFVEKFKLKNWNHVNTNSFFTKKSIEQYWNLPVDTVLYPMVDVQQLQNTTQKEPIILNVGRFFRRLHSKRQDILVQNFRELLEQKPALKKNWKLYLIGANEDDEYLAYVKKISEGLPVVFNHTLSREELVTIYKKAMIYWHATGFGIDEQVEPEKVEHFGITTIEAMAAGVIPLVVGKGGQREIMEDLPFLTWETQTECVSKTIELLSDKKLANQYQEKVRQRAQDFDRLAFSKRVEKLFTV